MRVKLASAAIVVGEVSFLEWTPGGEIRHRSFMPFVMTSRPALSPKRQQAHSYYPWCAYGHPHQSWRVWRARRVTFARSESSHPELGGRRFLRGHAVWILIP